ncbi:MAG: hypothetical protein D6725_07470 [Planctomycetota bacterium]|nr:MAG: hypothetical protein D6725_07470 [Planctomycetota bacterium]
MRADRRSEPPVSQRPTIDLAIFRVGHKIRWGRADLRRVLGGEACRTRRGGLSKGFVSTLLWLWRSVFRWNGRR